TEEEAREQRVKTSPPPLSRPRMVSRAELSALSARGHRSHPAPETGSRAPASRSRGEVPSRPKEGRERAGRAALETRSGLKPVPVSEFDEFQSPSPQSRQSAERSSARMLPARSLMRSLPREVETTYRELRTAALFDGLPNDTLGDATSSGDLDIVTVAR